MFKHHPREYAGQERSSLYDEIADKIIYLETGHVGWFSLTGQLCRRGSGTL